LINDSSYEDELLKSEDNIQLYMGLWSKSNKDVTYAIEAMKKILKKGKRHSILLMSYFLNMIQDDKLSSQTARQIISENSDDIEIMACYFRAIFGYISFYNIENHIENNEIGIEKHFENKKEAMEFFDILEKSEIEIESILSTIRDAYTNIKHCSICGNLCEGEICEICSSEKRDKSVICVVESVKDIIAFEKSETYNGLYHVLGGKIDPLNGVTIEDLNLRKLMNRLDGNVKEIILALNPDLEGETTSLYLTKFLKDKNVKISKIASGIPMGGNIEYTDMATLGRSLEGRVNVDDVD